MRNYKTSKNRAGDAITDLGDGKNVTSQYSPYQTELRGNGIVGTDDCDYERHAGAIKNTSICTNQPRKIKKEELLLDLREQFHSREKTCSLKKVGHQDEAYHKKRMGGSEKGCK